MRFFREFLTKVTLVVTLFFGSGVEGRVFIVTNTNDTTEITSLRGAIIAANAQSKDRNNIILLGNVRSRGKTASACTFYLTISGANEINARTGDLNITRGHLAIVGASSNVTIDATGLGDRVFQVFPRASLKLDNLVIKGGAALGYGGLFANGESGGGIHNAGILAMDNCTVTNNSSGNGFYVQGNGGGTGGGDGGGIYSSGTLTMHHCIVTGNAAGNGVDGAFGGNGGGIKNDGTCFLTDCVIALNQGGNGGGAEGNAFAYAGGGGAGGGLYNTGTMNLKNCVVSGNQCGYGGDGGTPGISWVWYLTYGGWGGSGGSGAGVFNVGKMTLDSCTVNGNVAGDGGGGGMGGAGGDAGNGGSGGGVYNLGSLAVKTSTISSNDCGSGGRGGIGYSNGGHGGGGGGGGGIFNRGSLHITSATIVLNQTGAGGDGGDGSDDWPYIGNPSGGDGGSGGGILSITNNDSAVLRNTIIALNSTRPGGARGSAGDPGVDGYGYDLSGDYTSQGFDLVGVFEGSTGFTNGAKADLIGSISAPLNPFLGSLQMNGGHTPTHALLLGSPAIDQGKSFGIHADQRGHSRPVNFSSILNAPGGDGSDIGAFELGAAAPQSLH